MDMAWEICSYEFASFILGTNVDAICIKKQGDWPGRGRKSCSGPEGQLMVDGAGPLFFGGEGQKGAPAAPTQVRKQL